MANYYTATERSLTRNCSVDCIQVTRYVDETLNETNQTTIVEMKFDLLKAKLSEPGGNITGASNLTMAVANQTSNVLWTFPKSISFFYSIESAPFSHDSTQCYGFQASLLLFCNILETQNFTLGSWCAVPTINGNLARFEDYLEAQAQVDMANYYTAAERSLTRNCSVDCIQVTRYVDEASNETNETTIVEMNFDPPKARLSEPGGNTTDANNLSMASQKSNVDAAGILMDPLDV
ncbi:hypothetical protein BYT27DRAFT_7218348 [Phlegmacium glaucopus]|nr:hypothetical protein BYT27DRAFT_7218348 [Phlegmacium glaucopus]